MTLDKARKGDLAILYLEAIFKEDLINSGPLNEDQAAAMVDEIAKTLSLIPKKTGVNAQEIIQLFHDVLPPDSRPTFNLAVNRLEKLPEVGSAAKS